MTLKIAGFDILVDDDMADTVLQHKWHVQSRHRGIYFAASMGQGGGKKKTVFLHRFIMGDPKGKFVDHKFGNHFDNRRENLRICEGCENSRNTKLFATNTSGYRGVTRRGKKWEANIKCNNRLKYLGRYSTPEEASAVYEETAKKLFGEFHREAEDK